MLLYYFKRKKIKTGKKMSNNQISLNIFSIISEKITNIYNDYAKLVIKINPNQETEQYNFDLW